MLVTLLLSGAISKATTLLDSMPGIIALVQKPARMHAEKCKSNAYLQELFEGRLLYPASVEAVKAARGNRNQKAIEQYPQEFVLMSIKNLYNQDYVYHTEIARLRLAKKSKDSVTIHSWAQEVDALYGSQQDALPVHAALVCYVYEGGRFFKKYPQAKQYAGYFFNKSYQQRIERIEELDELLKNIANS